MNEKQFNSWYRELESGYRAYAGETFGKRESELRRKCRQMRLEGATEEEVQEHYVNEYTRIIEQQERDFNKGAGAKYADAITKAERTLYGPGGQRYLDHLVSLASTPDDKLSELARLAELAGDSDLRRAIAHTANERGRRVLYQTWVDSQQDTLNAKRLLDTTPGKEQAITRMLTATRPPKAAPGSLQPTREDRQRHAEAERAKAAPRREFFGGAFNVSHGRRQVGRRKS